MTSETKMPFNVDEELAKLRHEKNNQSLRRLPSNATVQRRPLNHAPIASPFAGSDVQKVVYVSRKTPIMSAVKRVKKLLQKVEKRAMQGSGVDLVKRGEREGMKSLAEANERLEREREEVVVKASGRAMEQALRIAEWFRTREDEILCQVEVRTGNVSAIDDIVEIEEEVQEEAGDDTEQTLGTVVSSTLDEGDTTRELLGDLQRTQEQGSSEQALTADGLVAEAEDKPSGKENENTTKPKRRRKRKKPMYDEDDLPEARIRWVKTVEVAISLRG